MTLPGLKQQEIPLGHPDSCNFFQPSSAKPFLATPAAVGEYGTEVIHFCLARLQREAAAHGGLDSLQVFTQPGKDDLWFIDDGEGGAITALLPSDY